MKKERLIFHLCVLIFLTTVLFPSALCGLGKKPPPEPKTIEERIARQFHIEESVVLDLEEKGYGTEEVVKVLILATATGKMADEISIFREEGVSWEDIAERYGVGIDALNKETQKLLSEVVGKEKEGASEEKKPEIELEIEKELKKKLEMEKTE